MNLEEAKKRVSESLARQQILSDINQKIPAELEAATANLGEAQGKLAGALIALELGEVDEDQVKAIRREIQKNRTILEELPLLRKGIEQRDQREKGLVAEALGVIRAAEELDQAKVEYFEAKARVRDGMEQGRHSQNYEHRESFKRRVLDLQTLAERAKEDQDYWAFVKAEGLRE